MARRPRKRNLTESWADVSSDDDATSEESSYSDSHDEEISPKVRRSTPQLRTQPQRSTATSPLAASSHSNSPRQRMTRSSVEPELVMPSMRERTPVAYETKSSPRQSPRTSKKKASPKKATDLREEEEEEGTHYFSAIMKYCVSTLGYSMLWLQPLLSAAMAAMVVGIAVWYGRAFLHSLVTGWTPKNAICSTPVLSLLPFCPSQNAGKTPGAPEFDQLMTVQSQFDDVLSTTAEYGSLALDMKKSEASIRDLKHLVRYSYLPSSSELVFEFDGFIETARQASGDLTKFNAAVGHAVDRVLSTNRWTVQVIEGVAEREGGQGAISRFLYQTLPRSLGRHVRTLDEILLIQYLSHTSQVEEQIARLIISAQALLMILNDLDNRLDVIAGVVTRDGISVSRNKDELFTFLWTKLGGNRNSVKKLEDQLALLRNVNIYRKTAWAHVNAALLKLLAIQAGLEDLRERLAVAETVGLVVPLEQHLENVRMGVERLEWLRTENRKFQDRKIREVLINPGGEDGRRIEGQRY